MEDVCQKVTGMKLQEFDLKGSPLSLDLFLDPSAKKTVTYNGKTYNKFSSLTTEHPFLINEGDSESVIAAAKIVNHLVNGNAFMVIENPIEFRKRYQEEVTKSISLEEPSIYSASLYPRADPSSITAPTWESSTVLTFCAQDSRGILHRFKVTLQPRLRIENKPLPYFSSKITLDK